jgi:hypothetical protein
MWEPAEGFHDHGRHDQEEIFRGLSTALLSRRDPPRGNLNFWLLKIEKLLETAPPNSKVPFGPDQNVLIGSFVDSALAAVAKRNVHQGQRGMWRSVRARRNYGALENRKRECRGALFQCFWACGGVLCLRRFRTCNCCPVVTFPSLTCSWVGGYLRYLRRT